MSRYVCWSTNTLHITIKKGTDYVFSWKSKGVYNYEINSLYIACLHSMKLFGYRMGIKFDKSPIAVEQNNYLSKVVNVHIVYCLDAWPRNLTYNLNLQIACLVQLI